MLYWWLMQVPAEREVTRRNFGIIEGKLTPRAVSGESVNNCANFTSQRCLLRDIHEDTLSRSITAAQRITEAERVRLHLIIQIL